MANVTSFQNALDVLLQFRNSSGGDEEYVARLRGHSANAIAPERPQYLLILRA
jgi:hypothetical protein